MVTAQDWLNQNYSIDERRRLTTKLEITGRRWVYFWGTISIPLPIVDSLGGHLDLREFVNLRELNCKGNQITSLDVSGLTQLETLDCQNNQIATLDLRQNLGLKRLNCNENPLTEIIGLENLRQLFFVSCLNRGANNPSFRPINQLRNQITSNFFNRNAVVISAINNYVTNTAPAGHAAITTAITTAVLANNGDNPIIKAPDLAGILTALQGDATITATAGATDALTAAVAHHTVTAAYTNLGANTTVINTVLRAVAARITADTTALVGGTVAGDALIINQLINDAVAHNGGDNNITRATDLNTIRNNLLNSATPGTNAGNGGVANATVVTGGLNQLITTGVGLTIADAAHGTAVRTIITNAFTHHTINSAYNNNIGCNDLLNREIAVCGDVINSSPADIIPQTQKDQAQQEQQAYEAKIVQINPWQN